MADLSAYIDFSVQLDKSVSVPVIKLTDPNNYPSPIGLYLTGIFSIIQPDGISIDGNFTSPDIYWSGASLVVASKSLRLASDNNFQEGLYTIVYTIKSPGYTDTQLTKTFTLSYTQSTVIITDLTDVFTPSLEEIDSTQYQQSGFTVISTTRLWSADVQYIGTTLVTLTGTAILFDMSFSGLYFDAHYSISFSAIVAYTMTGTYTWVSVKDKLTASTQVDAYTPPTLADLKSSLAILKQQIDDGTYCGGCGCDCGCKDYTPYTKAVAIYDQLVALGQEGNTVGLQDYIDQLEKIFTCSGILNRTHTGLALPPYDWGMIIVALPKPIQFTVGSGGQYVPNDGEVNYNNPTLKGNNLYTIYRQAIGDWLVEGVDFNYLNTGGFTLLASTFVGGERYTLVFYG